MRVVIPTNPELGEWGFDVVDEAAPKKKPDTGK